MMAADVRFGRLLLDVIERRRRIKGEQGELLSALTRSYKRLRGEGMPPAPRVVRADQANSSIVYGDRLMLKLFRRPDEGINPDLEVGRFLSDKKFTGAPELAGALEYHAPRKEPMTFALVQGFVPHQADAAAYSHEELKRFFERVVTKRAWGPIPAARSLIDLLAEESPGPAVIDMIGAYLDAAKLLGRRTAELHLALVGLRHPGLRPRALFDPLPALDVPIDAQRDGQSLSVAQGPDPGVARAALRRGPRADGEPRPSRASLRCLPTPTRGRRAHSMSRRTFTWGNSCTPAKIS